MAGNYSQARRSLSWASFGGGRAAPSPLFGPGRPSRCPVCPGSGGAGGNVAGAVLKGPRAPAALPAAFLLPSCWPEPLGTEDWELARLKGSSCVVVEKRASFEVHWDVSDGLWVFFCTFSFPWLLFTSSQAPCLPLPTSPTPSFPKYLPEIL